MNFKIRRPDWIFKIDVSDVLRNPELTVDEQSTEIARRIRGSDWTVYRAEELDDYALEMLCIELVDVDNPHWFNEVWQEVYKLAEQDGAWIKGPGE